MSPGDRLISEMHYEPNGRKVTDRTRFGLWFHDKKPKYEILYASVQGPLSIPPLAKETVASTYFSFPAPVVLLRMFARAHYRGDSAQFTLVNPSGEQKKLSSVPNLSFQWLYEPEPPLESPAGSKLLYSASYDNSPEKVGNFELPPLAGPDRPLDHADAYLGPWRLTQRL